METSSPQVFLFFLFGPFQSFSSSFFFSALSHFVHLLPGFPPSTHFLLVAGLTPRVSHLFIFLRLRSPAFLQDSFFFFPNLSLLLEPPSPLVMVMVGGMMMTTMMMMMVMMVIAILRPPPHFSPLFEMIEKLLTFPFLLFFQKSKKKKVDERAESKIRNQKNPHHNFPGYLFITHPPTLPWQPK